MGNRLITGKRVLVTGGAGFIGSNLVEALLKQNNHVVCLDNFATGRPSNILSFSGNSNFTLIEGDIRNPNDCSKATDNVEIVLHQAALGSVPRSVIDPVTTNDVNSGGFVNMLTAAKNAGVRRFVYASSSSVYGDHPELPKVEDNIGNPLSPYAVSKYSNELYAGVFSSLYNIETIGLRYFNVFGKRQYPDGPYAAVIPKFVKSLMNAESPVIYGNGSHSRDFTYIDNVVAINQLAATTDNPAAINTVYNVACGKNISLNELFEIIRDQLCILNPDLKNINPVYGEPRHGDILHSLASIDKARTLLDYFPVYDVISGLREAIDWYWNNLK
ncbi:MAG: SDR family oxidoreductase [Bacteroidia bacterium]|nr:SDR family oxidoreductase [Bacteroidia bacterium]